MKVKKINTNFYDENILPQGFYEYYFLENNGYLKGKWVKKYYYYL